MSSPTNTRLRLLGLAATAVLLQACGGGGGDAGAPMFNVAPPPGPAVASPPPASASPVPAPPAAGPAPAPPPAVAQKCSSNNPYVADASAATTVGTLADEKSWLRAYFDQAYLWYAEVPAVNAGAPAYSVDTTAGYYDSIDNYFEALKTPAIVAGTSRRKDQFSFTYPTRAWNELAQSGVSGGYGIEWSVASPTPPRGIRIAYVEPGSPAATAGLRRGDRLQSVDGVSADDGTQGGVATLNAAVFPSSNGSVHGFVFTRGGTALPTANLTSAAITKQPVLVSRVLTVGPSTVGYMVFNDHIATAEAQLVAAIDSFRIAGATELVLDLRYNGGGYLYLASQLAYMIAGPTATAGKVFERLQYNDKRSAETNAAGASIGFYDVSCNLNSSLNCTTQNALPSLGFSRVTVLVSAASCSASESIINGLRGIDIEVRLVGTGTCGKPYGFTAKDNCGVSYFPIEFQGVNAKGQGDYSGGFAPTCTAADDLDRPLGDPAEGQLAAALTLMSTGSCAPSSSKAGAAGKAAEAIEARTLLRHVARESRIDLPSVRGAAGR